MTKPVVPPPLPAPYLVGVPPLSDESLTVLQQGSRASASERRKARRELQQRARQVLEARWAWEREHGVEIRPEVFTE